MVKTNNREARQCVCFHLEFKANNIFGENAPSGVYVVYSYGRHWPMFAYIGDVWYENSDRFSPTTSKHRSQVCPPVDTVKLPCVEMQMLIKEGRNYKPSAAVIIAAEFNTPEGAVS